MLSHNRLFTVVVLSAAVAALSARAAVAQSDRIQRILRETPLIDGHNDVPENIAGRFKGHLDAVDFAAGTATLVPPMHTDIARLKAGGVGGQFWSVWVSPQVPGADAVQAAFDQIDLVKRMVDRYPEAFELARTADDIIRIHKAGKIASLIGIEGGHAINDSLATLREMYRAGGRYMTLTHWSNNHWADAATDAPQHGGLTAFGAMVIREMNRLGMLVDLSHVSDQTMNTVLDLSKAPVIFSHSSARAIDGHPRNVPDTVLQRVATNGGIVMVNFSPDFISEAARSYFANVEAETARLKELMPGDAAGVEKGLGAWKAAHPEVRATLRQVADHIDHVRKVAGIDHVGLGSDFDGISRVPAGLEDVSRYPDLLEELARRGYSDDDLRKVAGLSILRVLKQAEGVAARLQKETRPNDARIEEVDRISPGIDRR
jgi:membrane dipeptidase